MTPESMQLTMEAGYLMSALDHYLTPGTRRDGFFATYGRVKLSLNVGTDDVDPEVLTTFFPDIAALAIEKGVSAEVYDGLRAEAYTRAKAVMETPGALQLLSELQRAVDRRANATRKARDN